MYKTTKSILTVMTLAGAMLIASTSFVQATEISEITSKEYYAAKYYTEALDDERIKKLSSESKRIKKIARSIKMKPKALKLAIEKVEGLSGKASELAKSAIESGFKGTRIDGRVLDVLINDSEPKHVIAYVRFQAKSSREVIKDASMIANIVSTKAPLVSTLSLSAIHPKAQKTSTKSVWSAKIGSDRMSNINPKRIEDYAERMYKRLFEVVDSKPF